MLTYFKHFFLKKNQHKKSNATEEEHNALLNIKDNPYLQSRVLWNDVYGETQKALHVSRGFNAFLVIGIIISIAGMVYLANQRAIKPYPFIIHGEHVLTSTEESQAAVEHLKPQLANVLAKGFIRNVRAVSTDSYVNRERQMAALAVLNQEALGVVEQFYQTHQANTLAKTKINNVKITSVLQSSPQTLVIRWQETWRHVKTGEVLAREQYIGEMVYQFDTPSTHELVLKHNPLGFYITHLTWSLEKIS